MLELFKKHMDFIGIAYNPETKPHDKYIVEFTDTSVNKHWLSFYATYMKGRKSGFDDMGVFAIQNIHKIGDV